MRNFLLVFLLFLAFPLFSYGEEEVYKTYTDIGELEPPTATISQVLSSRDEFDRKIFTLEGQVGELWLRRMVNGRKFTMFRLFESDPEKRINVYARGLVEGLEKRQQSKNLGPLQQA